jgi:hypothetical protein
MEIAKFWYVTLCTPEVSLQIFEGSYCQCHQGREATSEKKEGYGSPHWLMVTECLWCRYMYNREQKIANLFQLL